MAVDIRQGGQNTQNECSTHEMILPRKGDSFRNVVFVRKFCAADAETSANVSGAFIDKQLSDRADQHLQTPSSFAVASHCSSPAPG